MIERKIHIDNVCYVSYIGVKSKHSKIMCNFSFILFATI